jgi:hypothetical protein
MYVTADVAPPDKDWCSLTVDGCTLRVVGSPSNNPDAQFFNTKRDPDFDGDEGMRSLVFTDCTLRGDYYQSSTRPLEVRLPVRDGIKFNGNDAKVEYTNETFPDQTQCLFEIWSDTEFKNNTFQGTEVEIQPWKDTDIQDTDYVIDCTGTTVKDSFRRGLRLDGTDKNPNDGSDTAHQIGKVILNDVRVQGCARQGVSIVHADTVYAGDAVIVDNGTDTSANDNQRSNLELVDVSLFISGDSDYSASSADTNQAIFIDHTANSWAPSTTNLRLVSVDVTTASSGANIDDAGATVSYDARFNIETDKPEVLTDLLHRPDIVDTTTDAGTTGEIRRDGSTVSMYAGSKVAIRNAGDAQLSLIGDTNANQGGTQEWGITTVASDSDFVIRDETAGQVRLVVDRNGDVGLGGYTTPSFSVEMNGALRIRNSSSDPSSVGEFRVNGNDVKVYSDGAVRNLSDIGGGIDIEDSGTSVIAADGINFGSNLNVTDDGDGTVTVDGSSSGDTHIDLEINNVDQASDIDVLDFNEGTDINLSSSSGDDTGERDVTINHADTSSQGAVNTSGDTIIDSITPDGRGHVTEITTRTLQHSDLTVTSNDHHTKPSPGDGLTGDLAVDSTVARTNTAETFTDNVDVQGSLTIDDTGDANLLLDSANHQFNFKVDDSLDRLKVRDGTGLIAEFRDSASGAGFECQGGIAMFNAGTPTQTSLSTENSATIDTTYGTNERDVIKNTRQRVSEIEVALKDMGLLT